MPSVSYLVPALDCNDWLAQSILSILKDPYKDREIVVISNGPNLFSREDLVNKMGVDNDSVKVIRSLSVGVSAALNDGIDAVDCDFIARLDSDDLNIPGRTAHQVEVLTHSEKLVGVGGNAILIDSEGGRIGRLNLPEIKTNAEMRSTLGFDNPYIHPAMLLRADVLRAFRYDERMKKCQDWYLWGGIAGAGLLVSNIQRDMISYRRHPAQESSVKLNDEDRAGLIECVQFNLALTKRSHTYLYQRNDLIQNGRLPISQAGRIFCHEIKYVDNIYSARKLISNLTRAIKGRQ